MVDSIIPYIEMILVGYIIYVVMSIATRGGEVQCSAKRRHLTQAPPTLYMALLIAARQLLKGKRARQKEFPNTSFHLTPAPLSTTLSLHTNTARNRSKLVIRFMRYSPPSLATPHHITDALLSNIHEPDRGLVRSSYRIAFTRSSSLYSHALHLFSLRNCCADSTSHDCIHRTRHNTTNYHTR